MRAVSGIVDGVHYFFAQGGMTVIVPGPMENLETFPLGGRFCPSIVHFSRRADEIKIKILNSVGLSVNSFRCVLFITHIRLLTTTLHVCPFKTKNYVYSYLIFSDAHILFIFIVFLPFKATTTMQSFVAEPCISTNPSTPFTPSNAHIGASATCGSSSSSGDDLSYYLPSPSRTARSPWRFLKPILPPSTFFIPRYEGLQSDDSHDTEEEKEERDDTPVKNCHSGGRDDIADDSTNRDIVNKGSDDIVNNKATKPIQTIQGSLRPSIRRSLRPHGKLLYAGQRD
jgi:hypothetical protein